MLLLSAATASVVACEAGAVADWPAELALVDLGEASLLGFMLMGGAMVARLEAADEELAERGGDAIAGLEPLRDVLGDEKGVGVLESVLGGLGGKLLACCWLSESECTLNNELLLDKIEVL